MPQLGTFARAVWNSAQDRDPKIGLRIVDHALGERQKEAALSVIRQIVAGAGEKPELVIPCIHRLIRAEEFSLARSLIQQWSTKLVDNADFQVEWAWFVVASKDKAAARDLFNSQAFRPASILAKRPHVYLRLLQLAGRTDELEAALEPALDRSIAAQDFDHLRQIGRFFAEVGQLEIFRKRLEESLPKSQARRLLDMVTRYGEPSLFGNVGEEIEF
jgi:hypothetical protein